MLAAPHTLTRWGGARPTRACGAAPLHANPHKAALRHARVQGQAERGRRRRSMHSPEPCASNRPMPRVSPRTAPLPMHVRLHTVPPAHLRCPVRRYDVDLRRSRVKVDPRAGPYLRVCYAHEQDKEDFDVVMPDEIPSRLCCTAE